MRTHTHTATQKKEKKQNCIYNFNKIQFIPTILVVLTVMTIVMLTIILLKELEKPKWGQNVKNLLLFGVLPTLTLFSLFSSTYKDLLFAKNNSFSSKN